MTQDDVVALLRELCESGATELHVKVPARPVLRLEGRLVPMQRPGFTPPQVQRLLTLLLGLARTEVPLATVDHRELAFGVSGLGRFRLTVYRQRGSLALTIAPMATSIPTLASLGLAPNVEEVLTQPGLTLICGGSQRAGTMASLVDRYNASHRGLVVVLEDPLTHLHRDGTAIIAQRGVGCDVQSLAAGVQEATRQRADLIAVGDVPDRETAESVLRAAEEGRTVLAAVAAPDTNLAPSWLLRMYASDRDMDVKARVKRLLRAVVCVPDVGSSRVVYRRNPLQKAS